MTSADSPLGRVIDGRYRIEREVGAGGMGVVYEARQLKVDRPVAVKVLRPERIGDEAAVQQFLAEARAVGRLTSPHTVTLHDAGTMEDGAPYLAMELLEGATLRKRLKGGALELDEAVRVLDGVALSLAEAHGRGLVHRDLKPANVFLADTPGHVAQVKVLDFGLAQLVSGKRSRRAAGTLLYMAPEALRGEAADARGDVYALGMVAYEMLAGAHPFGELEREALIDAQLNEVPEALDAVAEEELPEALVALVARCLAKPRRLRPKDAGAFRKALRAACDLPEEVTRTSVSGAVEAGAPTLGSQTLASETMASRTVVSETVASETVVSRTLPQAVSEERGPSARRWLVPGGLALAAAVALGVMRGPAEDAGEPASSAEPAASVVEEEVSVETDASAEAPVEPPSEEAKVAPSATASASATAKVALPPPRVRPRPLPKAPPPPSAQPPSAQPPEPSMKDRVHDYLD